MFQLVLARRAVGVAITCFSIGLTLPSTHAQIAESVKTVDSKSRQVDRHQMAQHTLLAELTCEQIATLDAECGVNEDEDDARRQTKRCSD